MSAPAPVAGPPRRLIAAAEWRSARYGWAEGLRRDAGLSPTTRLVGHVLAFDFANHETMQCDPSLGQIAAVLGCSADTVKRAVHELEVAGWITRISGRGRGRSTAYGFLTRAVVAVVKGGRTVAAKGGAAAPFSVVKGGMGAPFSGPQKGADLHGKGGKSAPAHNIAKPCKNHGARAPAPAFPETLLRWVAEIRAGETAKARYLSDLDVMQLARAGLLDAATIAGLHRAGLVRDTALQLCGIEPGQG